MRRYVFSAALFCLPNDELTLFLIAHLFFTVNFLFTEYWNCHMTKVFTRNGVQLKWKYAINNQRQHMIVLTLNQSTIYNISNSSMKQYIKLAYSCIEHHGIKT